jgi:hypothetical protein
MIEPLQTQTNPGLLPDEKNTDIELITDKLNEVIDELNEIKKLIEPYH